MKNNSVASASALSAHSSQAARLMTAGSGALTVNAGHVLSRTTFSATERNSNLSLLAWVKLAAGACTISPVIRVDNQATEVWRGEPFHNAVAKQCLDLVADEVDPLCGGIWFAPSLPYDARHVGDDGYRRHSSHKPSLHWPLLKYSTGVSGASSQPEDCPEISAGSVAVRIW